MLGMCSARSNTALPTADSFFLCTWINEMASGFDSYLSLASRITVLVMSNGFDGKSATRVASSIGACSVAPAFSALEPRFHETYTEPGRSFP